MAKARAALDASGGDDNDASLTVVLGIDLSNACGNSYRSVEVNAARRACPGVAGIAAAQYQHMCTTVWQRSEGNWRQTGTARGGWQGSRLKQMLFEFQR